MTKLLIVETNINHYAHTNEPTGLWLSETAEFLAEIAGEDIEVDFVSPKGGYVPVDPRSLKKLPEDVMAIYQDEDFINRGLRDTLQPSEVDSSQYSAIYFTGGHGVMWDFINNSELQKITREIYEKNGYVLSVCHGIAGLFNVKLSDGEYLISGKRITGFTKTEEILAQKNKIVPFNNEKMAADRQASFQKKRFFKSHVVTDGRLLTGQNPFSTRALARTYLKERM